MWNVLANVDEVCRKLFLDLIYLVLQLNLFVEIPDVVEDVLGVLGRSFKAEACSLWLYLHLFLLFDFFLFNFLFFYDFVLNLLWRLDFFFIVRAGVVKFFRLFIFYFLLYFGIRFRLLRGLCLLILTFFKLNPLYLNLLYFKFFELIVPDAVLLQATVNHVHHLKVAGNLLNGFVLVFHLGVHTFLFDRGCHLLAHFDACLCDFLS